MQCSELPPPPPFSKGTDAPVRFSHVCVHFVRVRCDNLESVVEYINIRYIGMVNNMIVRRVSTFSGE